MSSPSSLSPRAGQISVRACPRPGRLCGRSAWRERLPQPVLGGGVLEAATVCRETGQVVGREEAEDARLHGHMHRVITCKSVGKERRWKAEVESWKYHRVVAHLGRLWVRRGGIQMQRVQRRFSRAAKLEGRIRLDDKEQITN